MVTKELPEHFIPIPECEKILATPLRVLTCWDGSELSESGVAYTLSCLMLQDKRNTCALLHIYNDSKEAHLPLKYRKATIEAEFDARLTAAVPPDRARLVLNARDEKSNIATQILDEARKQRSDFIVMGFLGRKREGKGRITVAADSSENHSSSGEELPISSNNMAVLGQSKASVIIMQTEVNEENRQQTLPFGRPARFVVSVSLNAASTKAFIDALHLSKPGDIIDVVYVKCFMERTESDYTRTLREKYNSFFSGLKGSTNSKEFVKFSDRVCNFLLLEKRKGTTTAQMVNDYADANDADFIVVGTNTMRLDRGKPVLGSVSADIIVETSRTIVVSHYTPK